MVLPIRFYFLNKTVSNILNSNIAPILIDAYHCCLNVFPVWLRNRFLSAGLEPVPSHNENNVRIELQTIFYEYQNIMHKINTSFVSPGLQ